MLTNNHTVDLKNLPKKKELEDINQDIGTLGKIESKSGR